MTDAKRILCIYGTRPEAIKMAPVIRRLQNTSQIDCVTCATGQHKEMVRQVENLFNLTPDYELDVMRPNQTLSALTGRLFEQISSTIEAVGPEWIVAQGDTTTVLVAAICAYYSGRHFGHVEAGLRTGDLAKPFPEEFNRVVADKISTQYYCPTENSRHNLLSEGVPSEKIFVTGNTVIDALQIVSDRPFDMLTGPLSILCPSMPIVMITAHRRESFGETFQNMCGAIAHLAEQYPGYQFVYPVHLNPNVQGPVNVVLGNRDNIFLLPPLDYLALVNLMKRATLILTDSGGIQEEAPGLGIPVLVMRDTTERPEGVDSGVVKLVGTSAKGIIDGVTELLNDAVQMRRMRQGTNPYGDGTASAQIVEAIISAEA